MNQRFASRSIPAALLLVVLAFAGACASDPAANDPDQEPRSLVSPTLPRGGYSAETGPNAVGSIPEGSVAAGGSELALTVDYPIKGGPYPLIIWSHDLGGRSRDYIGLSSYWASFGYVVVKPRHADTRESALAPDAWAARAKDVSTVIDSIPELVKKYPELEGKIDASKIGVGGHLHGAFTAMMAGGMTPFARGAALRAADPRIKAVVAMSPSGPDAAMGLTTESWRELKVPTLFLTGGRDARSATEGPAWRREAFELSPAGQKYFISIEAARTESFAGSFSDVPRERFGDDDPFIVNQDPFSRRNPPMQRERVAGRFESERTIFGIIKMTALAFWDAQLRDEQRGKDFLERLRTRGDIEFAFR